MTTQTSTSKVQQQRAAPTEPSISANLKGELKRVLVEDIVPDPNQPRKTFYKVSLHELEKSVAAVGDILESLLLRKTSEEKYMIIFGERRWRVARKLGLKDVPAMIIEATNEETLSLQLIENLQREDLLPLEQAAGFKKLADECQLDVPEIALQVGKTEYFVRQQVKLLELTPQWQKMLNKSGIPIGVALQIASLPSSIQKKLYSNNVSKEDEQAENPRIHLNKHQLAQYKGLLAEATFDIHDPALDKKVGACSSCPFNSACYSLFPEEQTNPRCNNIDCFNNKTSLHFNNELIKAREDPTIVLVYEAYTQPDFVTALKSEGTEILKLGYCDDCRQMIAPRQPVWEEYDQERKEQEISLKIAKENFREDIKRFEEKKADFEKNVASGKYLKAFVVYDSSGRLSGRFIHIELNEKKPTAKEAQNKIATGNATLQDITQEINRLKSRETRSSELDQVKIHEKIVSTLKENASFQAMPQTSNQIDNTLVLFWLLESIGFGRRSIIDKVIKQPTSNKTLSQYFKWLTSLTNREKSFLIRQIILEKYGTHLPNSKGGYMIRKMAESLRLAPIDSIEKEQQEKATKRRKLLQNRLSELDKLKKQHHTRTQRKTAAKQITPKTDRPKAA